MEFLVNINPLRDNVGHIYYFALSMPDDLFIKGATTQWIINFLKLITLFDS